MPRRKQTTLKIQDIKLSEEIINLLKQEPQFEGCDFTTVKVSALETIEPKIKDIDRAIDNLERYLYINKNCCETFDDLRYVEKQKLAKMLKVSRSTLDRWVENGFVKPHTLEGIGDIYDPFQILDQLKSYKIKC